MRFDYNLDVHTCMRFDYNLMMVMGVYSDGDSDGDGVYGDGDGVYGGDDGSVW